MSRRIKLIRICIFAFVFLGLSCNGDTEIKGPDSGSYACTTGQYRCQEGMAQKCESGNWSDWDDCSSQGMICNIVRGEATCIDGGDGDTDTDDTDPEDCGLVDRYCCTNEPFCNDGLLAVDVIDENNKLGCGCFTECTVNTCTVGNIDDEQIDGGSPVDGGGKTDGGDSLVVEGYCNDPTQGDGPKDEGNCINSIDFPDPFISDDCTPDELNCTTKSGETEGTKCMNLKAGVVCLKICQLPDDDGCDANHYCSVLTSTSTDEFMGGACLLK